MVGGDAKEIGPIRIEVLGENLAFEIYGVHDGFLHD